MATTMQRRQANPERWQAALGRAIAAGVQVRQLAGSGAWIATSATDPTKAYELEVVAGVARSCTCQAGEFGDPVCCHRARYYADAGLLDPEPSTPAAPAAAPCRGCFGDGYVPMYTGGRLSDWIPVPCLACRRRKEAPAPIAA